MGKCKIVESIENHALQKSLANQDLTPMLWASSPSDE